VVPPVRSSLASLTLAPPTASLAAGICGCWAWPERPPGDTGGRLGGSRTVDVGVVVGEPAGSGATAKVGVAADTARRSGAGGAGGGRGPVAADVDRVDR
jgi:hypothetical protein